MKSMGFRCPECNEEVYYDGEDVYCEACGLVLNRKEVFCPQCGGELIHAQGEYGEIIVCSNHPNCDYSRSID